MNKQTKMSLQMSGVALAVMQAFAPQAMAQEQQADSSTVVVSGIRASARSSVAIKRDTLEVVDSITAEDIGKLPDSNVAETLTRIPGVQGYRYGGQGASPVGAGSGLTIRGLSNQTASQINGRAFNTAGGREFNIESAIPGMIAGVDVYKNPSAEHIEGGIGGLVNIRNRNPSDFKGPTFAASLNFSNNDLAHKTDPEAFVMGANRFDLGGGSRLGVMGAAVYQKSTDRSDNNPANRGAALKRAVRADSAEYATRAAANTSNSPFQPMSAYVGRSDVSFLDNVSTLPTSSTVGANMPNLSGLTPEQISNVMSATGLNSNVFQETIMRERKGLNLAADYRVSNTLRFYTEANYLYYLYHQNYRGLNSVDGANVQNLQTTPFNFTESLANRNFNGGSNDVLVNKRLQSGSFLNSAVTTIGGDEHTPYTTWVGAAGAEWSPTAELSLKADFSYIRSKKTQDNRSVTMDSAPGKLWSTNRIADGAPHQLTFTGPDLADPSSYVFRSYDNGTNQSWNDKGNATVLSGAYSTELGWINKIKFGTRYAEMESTYRNFRFTGKPLTTDGKALAADRSNAINVSTMTGVVQNSPTNFMRGDTGYSGGYIVYSPDALLGNQVAAAFPNAGIVADGNYPEIGSEHRFVSENTLAGWLVGEFSGLDDRLKGNFGVRVVRTRGKSIARVPTVATGALVDVTGHTSYTNALPSLNATYDITPDTLVRFAYGKGLTRAGLGDLNPSISGVNTALGTANVGNAELRPLTANSVDLSLERYFNKTNYAAIAVFNKDIDGFFNKLVSCQTLDPSVAGPYTGNSNGCTGGQYAVSKTVNAEKGYARGAELSGQYFFDGSAGVLENFGFSGSYTYVKTSNPLNFGTAAAPNVVSMPQPFQAKHNFSVTAMYEDQKLSGRLAYTWRSMSLFNDVAPNPIDSRSIGAYGILDGSINYEIDKNLSLSFNVRNILDRGLNRYIGEPDYKTGVELQHYENGRIFNIGLRYKFGN